MPTLNKPSFLHLSISKVSEEDASDDSQLISPKSRSIYGSYGSSLSGVGDSIMDSYSKRLLQIKSPRYGADFKITEEGIKIKGLSVFEYKTIIANPTVLDNSSHAPSTQEIKSGEHVMEGSSERKPSSSDTTNTFPLNFPVLSVEEFHKYPMKELGNGSFGIVYRVAISNPKVPKERLYFAEKRVTDTAQKQLDLIFKEVKTIFECDSPYLVKLHECFYKECTYYSKCHTSDY